MRNILAIVERELRAYFISPVAYVVLTVFVLLSGIFFLLVLNQIIQMATINALQSQRFGTGPAPIDMPFLVSSNYLGSMQVILLFTLPMITMVLFSDEKRRGTIELLLTLPLTDVQIVLGKFLAAVSFYAIMLATTWIPMSVLFLYGDPAWRPILTGYLGLFLYGVALLALGLFVSTLTENQIVAGFASFGTALILWIIDGVAQNATALTREVLTYVSILGHMDDFRLGVISTTDVIYYLSMMTLALFLTYRSIDSMRWRG